MTVMAKHSGSSVKTINKKQKGKFKYGKVGKKETSGKRGRLIVRNLPFRCNEEELSKHFSSFGEIKDINLLRRPDNKLVGCGFVEFKSRLDANRAAEQLNGKPFLGRQIYIERAVSRDNYGNEEKSNLDQSYDDGNTVDEMTHELDYSNIKEEPVSSDEEGSNFDEPEIKKEKPDLDEKNSSHNQGGNEHDSKYVKKADTTFKNLKKARLIVRNLSFKATEEKLKSHFAQYGEIEEVNLLRRPDNTLVGCGFVQFNKKSSAAKAIHHASGKPFLGRPIIVDWAIAKDRFKQMQEESLNKQIKKEDVSDDETKPIDVSNTSIKKEEKSDDESEEESGEESNKSESEEDEDEDSEDDDDESDVEPEIKKEPQVNRKSDVDEGKTVFVKNLPFTATDKEFRECMEQFGPVFYALICKDKLTEHSKGSGFVKFKSKEDAEKCLSAGTELTLNGTILDPHPALKRAEIQQLNDKKKEKKDNRNLYLVKEGVIIAGTKAAQGVSVSDMERRLQLEQWKTTKLRNLNMFVSRTRLVVHNLPLSLSDKQLRKLFQKHAGPQASIKEARIMRNLKKFDTNGQNISKGYGFVSFEKHEDALKALRSINNNPSVFTPTLRPIVSFSIENKTVLNSKTKRLVRSKQKNPLCKDYNPDNENVEVPNKKLKRDNTNLAEENEPQFAGIVTKPGMNVKMRKAYKLKDQAQKHVQDVRKQKQEIKMSRKMKRKEHFKKKQVEKKTKKQKNTNSNDMAFNNLVESYKSKMLSQSTSKKKWYEG